MITKFHFLQNEKIGGHLMNDMGYEIHRESQLMLGSKGVKQSFQRLLILEYVMKQKNTHACFPCSVCSHIFDIQLHSPLFSKNIIEGHRIEEIQIHFNGICKDC